MKKIFYSNFTWIISICFILSKCYLFAVASPQIVMDAQGNAVSIWHQECSDNCHIIQSSFMAFGKEWNAPVSLTSGGVNSVHPQIAINDEGKVVAIWLQVDKVNSTCALMGAMFHSLSNWSAPEQISSPDELVTSYYKVNINNEGNIIAIWNSYPFKMPSNQLLIQSATARFGGKWNSPSRLHA